MKEFLELIYLAFIMATTLSFSYYWLYLSNYQFKGDLLVNKPSDFIGMSGVMGYILGAIFLLFILDDWSKALVMSLLYAGFFMYESLKELKDEPEKNVFEILVVQNLHAFILFLVVALLIYWDSILLEGFLNESFRL